MAEDQSRALARSGGGGTIERRGFGSEEIETTGETAGAVLAAQARAMVEARFVMAIRRPRDWSDVRRRLLDACERPGFAEGYAVPGQTQRQGAAWYKKPVGDGVEGFSIRFAEEAMRCMTNMDEQVITVYDDDDKRLLNIIVVDLESNTAHSATVVVSKTVERKHKDRGACKNCDIAISSRLNSYGETVHTIPATDDDVLNKQNALASKALRQCILRHIPGDIQSECRARILEIRFGDIAKDPKKFEREISDGFAKLNVLPSGLKRYLGHDLGESTPAELSDLRDLYKAINKGETTWQAALAQALADQGEPEESQNPEPERKNGKAEDLAAKLRAKRGAPEPEPPQDEPEEVPEPETPLEEEGEPTDLRGRMADAFVACGEAKGTARAKEVLELTAGTVKLNKVPDDKVELAIAALVKASRE